LNLLWLPAAGHRWEVSALVVAAAAVAIVAVLAAARGRG
jgi:hypothetical protein